MYPLFNYLSILEYLQILLVFSPGLSQLGFLGEVFPAVASVIKNYLTHLNEPFNH